MRFQHAAQSEALWEGEMVGVLVAGTPVLLARHQGSVRAFCDRCPHKGASLNAGRLQGALLTCAAHLWCFDVGTGAGINPPSARLQCYPAREENGSILVCLDSETKDAPGTPARERRTSAPAGPILLRSAAATAVVAAIREATPDAHVLDRGAYLRISAPGCCRVRRSSIERHLGAPFPLPAELEKIMPSFAGCFEVSADDASWRTGQED